MANPVAKLLTPSFRTIFNVRGTAIVNAIRALCITAVVSFTGNAIAQGTWTPVTFTAPDNNAGVMLLLTDGTVLCKSQTGLSVTGASWDKLSPDINGSYVNGTWSELSMSSYTRLYCSTQMLKDGRVYIAGGEYGTGKASSEIYDPLLDLWLPGPNALIAGDTFSDANSEILTDGKVLQAIVTGGSRKIYIYDPVANTYTLGPSSLKSNNESTWVKLPDNSILFVNLGDTTSERYIPSLNIWKNDATLHVRLYDPYGYETGPGILLPDGRAFFIGSTGKTAYYTPSGDTSKGHWTTGPNIPDSMGAPDAAASLMVDGKLLCAFSKVPDSAEHFPSPTFFYEFNYLTDSFKRIHAPDGHDSLHGPSYVGNMLTLPDGSVLFSVQGKSAYYVYKPAGAPIAAGKPTVENIIKIDCYTYRATGKLFNGISEGSCYGDDWQMATNYPLIRLIDDLGSVRYARTYNWNRTGVMTGSLPDTTTFSIDPLLVPEGNYLLQLVVNGFASDTIEFSTCYAGLPVIAAAKEKEISVYPNPAQGSATIAFTSKAAGMYQVRMIDAMGRLTKEQTITAEKGDNHFELNLNGLATGIYTIILGNETNFLKTRLAVD